MRKCNIQDLFACLVGTGRTFHSFWTFSAQWAIFGLIVANRYWKDDVIKKAALKGVPYHAHFLRNPAYWGAQLNTRVLSSCRQVLFESGCSFSEEDFWTELLNWRWGLSLEGADPNEDYNSESPSHLDHLAKFGLILTSSYREENCSVKSSDYEADPTTHVSRRSGLWEHNIISTCGPQSSLPISSYSAC